MLAARVVAVCAAGLLAAVFSVQQGAHGPLVVYKLEMKPHSAQPAPPPASAAAEAIIVIPSRAPQVLGTVVMPADRTDDSHQPLPLVPLLEPVAPDPVASGVVTLQAVSDEIIWRRETVGKLPRPAFAPRF